MSITTTVQLFLYTFINLLIQHLQTISRRLAPPQPPRTPQPLPTQTTLLPFPPEIRTLIYHHLIHSPSIVEITCLPIPNSTHHRRKCYTLTLPWHGLLTTNKRCNAELTHHLTTPTLLCPSTRLLRIGGPHLWPIKHVLLTSRLAQRWAGSLVFSERRFWDGERASDFKGVGVRAEYLGMVRRMVGREGGALREVLRRRPGVWQRGWRVWVQEEGSMGAGCVQVLNVEVGLEGVDYERVERRQRWAQFVVEREGGVEEEMPGESLLSVGAL